MEGKIPYVANEGMIEMQILYKIPEFTLETVESLDPVEYMDKYVPTKYGILFRERLFVNLTHCLNNFLRLTQKSKLASLLEFVDSKEIQLKYLLQRVKKLNQSRVF